MVVAMGFGRLLMQLVLVGVLVAPAAAQDDRPNCPQRCGISRNKFTVVGCNSYAYLHGFGRKENYSTGCMSICDSPHNVYVKSCAGSGCCQIEIPDGLYSANVTAYRFNERENVSKFNPCTYAFIVEDGKFNFSSKYVENIPQDKFPMVLEWSIHDYTNQEASEGISSACKLNAFSYKPDSVPGYRCKCNEGYVGNPYLGCQDVNECEDPSLNKCVVSKNCVNTEGNYTCLCPKGYRRDGLRERGTGCTAEDKQSLKTKAIIGSSIAISLLFVIMACALCGIQRRKINELKQKNFRDNGGPVLRQLLSKIERSAEKAKIFTEDELKKATNNFNESEIVGRGGFGIVYKGTLNNDLVAIKKSRVMDHDQIEQFVNEELMIGKCLHVEVRTDFEETEPLLGPPTNFCSTSLSIGPDSIKYQAALQLESGR
ncbi:hypothetical protein GH714_000833 [Hevea brasiliensis]|uniref:EGF-like domain-containing protein n=1 Tax=Hevea brasiliensis TaxID=3981 RepID=A0A6A6L7S8_HEVBR|nr:hypothetical protein GH714_000833 [Hevea brasiliensis]